MLNGVSARKNRSYTCDVCVVGGGPAGTAASLSSSLAGADTILIERSSYLGGQAVHSNVAAFCGFHSRGNPPVPVVVGMGGLVLNKLREAGDNIFCWVSPSTGNSSIRFNAELLKLVLDMLMEENEVRVMLHTSLVEAEADDGRLKQVICSDDAGLFTVEAKVFIDATGDANLAFLSGCETKWGDENGVTQQAGLIVRMDRLPADISTVPGEMAKAIVAAKSAGLSPLPKENGFMIRIDGADTGFLTTPSVSVGDLEGITLTKAEMYLRRQAHAYARALREYMPGMAGCRLVSTGPQMGLREGRRVTGEYILTTDNVLGLEKSETVVARGGWSPETHKNDTVAYTHLRDKAWFDIPIGALKAKGISNLWCGGRNISCDSTAQASIRVMGTAFATGHAAGVAAALTLDSPRYDYQSIKKVLEGQGALL